MPKIKVNVKVNEKEEEKGNDEKKIKNMILLIIQSMKVIIFRNAEEITKKASNIATQIENQTEEKI